MATIQHFALPDPNDPVAIDRHRQAVLEQYSNVFQSLDHALTDAVPKARNLFSLLGGRPDKAVHATNTRYVVREVLTSEGVVTEDETPSSETIELEWVANCGICIQSKGVEIRVLKAANGAIPKANSDARARFYCSNQLSLFWDLNNDPESTDLKLVALWDVDDDLGYTGLEIACPRGELTDRSVDCFWTHRWSDERRASGPVEQNTPDDSDLDIRPIINNEDESAGRK